MKMLAPPPEPTAPVILVVFNRPDTTRRVLDALAAIQPQQLFVVADGPRHAEDEPKCEAVRRLFDKLPWPCEVHRNFSDVNLGCGRRLPTGLDWVFEQVDRAIILEDDCVPDPSFFPYCEQLLERYADDPTVGCISGDTVPGIGDFGDASYRFSWLPLIWGWATWRRAWAKYDHYLNDWPASRSAGWLRSRISDPLARKALTGMFDEAKIKGDAFSVWDYQWTYACLRHGMRSIQPRQVLVSNVGFGPDATHTRGKEGARAFLKTDSIDLPLTHPRKVAVDQSADDVLFHSLHPYVRRQHRSWAQRFNDVVARGKRRVRASIAAT